MPTYGYRCTKCKHTFEIFQKMTDEPIAVCEKCDGPVKRILFPVGIVFKGSGFHVNDYRKPEKTGGNGEKSSSKDEEKPKTEAAKS